MGPALSEPITTKDSFKGSAKGLEFGGSEM